MRHLDLFSGIGGFALAASQVFKDYETVAFVEIDPFCQSVLKKNFPEVKIHGDIRTVTNTTRERLEGGKREKPEGARNGLASEIDLLTGGFPCQPFSQAGRRKGTDDNRYLWPEMLRVIREFQPRWIIGENVAGLLTIEQGVVFGQIISDLEEEDYQIETFIIPACAVNAPHRRDRVWIVANSKRKRWDERKEKRSKKGKGCRYERYNFPDWSRNWQEVALAACHDGMDDGVSRRMGESTISRARWRREAIKACGNAIVPQVAVEIMKGISSIIIKK